MDAVKQIGAGLLNVGYVDAGPADRPAVLLHLEVGGGAR
jgi:hypothetical protein